MAEAKILILDIEWRPVQAFVWRAWDENIQPSQIIQDGGLLCVGVKWFGSGKVDVYSEWEHGHEEMLRLVHAAMSEADAIVGYNSSKYDLPKLNGEFVLYGLPPVPPAASIDLIKTVKKLGLFMNRLAFVGPFLGLGKKLEHEGFSLWRKVMEGDAKAQKKMSRYCAQDVLLTEKLYKKLLPYITNHPKLRPGDTCPNCESTKTQKRGYRFTRYFRIQRNQCQSCGTWFETTRQKIR